MDGDIERMLQLVKGRLESKGDEYDHKVRHSNILKSAYNNEVHPWRAAYFYISKHLSWLADEAAKKDFSKLDRSQIKEKVGDIIAYCLIIAEIGDVEADALFARLLRG